MPDDDADDAKPLGPMPLPSDWRPPGSTGISPDVVVRAATKTAQNEAIRKKRAAEAERIKAEMIDRAARTPTYVVISLQGLRGSGSDIDEIYGAFRAQVTSNGRAHSLIHPYEGFEFKIVDVKGSIDLSDGKKWPRGVLPGGLFDLGIGASGDFSVNFTSDLMDEDDGRGGSNDERFFFQATDSRYQRMTLRVPTHTDKPEFHSTNRVRYTLSAGRLNHNRLFIDVGVRWFRKFDFEPPQN